MTKKIIQVGGKGYYHQVRKCRKQQKKVKTAQKELAKQEKTLKKLESKLGWCK